MEKYLPEWFDEKEFENFLGEGFFTRQAWTRNIQRWRRTKYMLRRMVGSTPMKFMKRAMQQKYAIMARTAAQNARDIQAAQNREQSMKRNFAEEFNNGANELSERLNSGSSNTFFSLGNKVSPGEQARNKVPFGNEKAKAKWKKRFQRRLMKARGMKVENFEYDVIEEAKKDSSAPKTQSYKKDEKSSKSDNKKKKFDGKKEKKSPTEMIEKGDFSQIVVVEINGKVKIESWNSVKGKKNVKFLKKRGQVRSKSDLEPFRKGKLKGKFGWTETYSKIFPNDKKEQETSAKETRPKQKEEKKTQKKKAETKKESPKKTEPVQQKQLKFGKELLPPERQVAPTNLPSQQSKKSVEMAELMMDKESLKKLSKMKFFGKDDEILETYQKESDANPWISQIGSKNLPRVLNFASDINDNLKGKELFLLSLDGRQNCFNFSRRYKDVNAMDRASKADYIVFPKEKLETFARYLSVQSEECEALKKEIVQESVAISQKSGKSKLASTYATDTLAKIDEVKNLLMSVGQQLPPEFYKLIENFNKLKSLSDGSNLFKNLSSVVTSAELEKMTPDVVAKLDAQRQSNIVAAQQYFAVSTPIVNDIKKMTNELFENEIVKAAFVYAYTTDVGKFDENSLGRVDGMIFADEKGDHVGSMNVPPTFEDALKDERFMTYAKRHKVNIKGKNMAGQPLAVMPGPNELEVLGARKPLMASFDPLLNDEIDQLFEYTFLPPDKTIEVESPTSAEGMPQPEMPQASRMGFSEFSNQEDFKFTPENIFTILNQVGIIENVDFGVLDYTDVGMQLSSLQSPISNLVVVNGREYSIPVFNVDLDEDIFSNYDALNEMAIQMVEDGIPYDGVRSVFIQELNLLIEKKARNYKREYALFHSKPEQIKRRSKRVTARRRMARRYGKKKIAGKDIDHKDGNAMNNSDSNLRVRSIHKNRSDNGHSKKSISEKVNWWNNLEGCGRATEKRLKLTPGQWDNIDPGLKKLLFKGKDTCK